MLKLEINNKIFTGESFENNKIKILLNENLDDIDYFINNNGKQKEINFTTNFKKGILKHCTYRLSFDESYVIIYYEDVVIDNNQIKPSDSLKEVLYNQKEVAELLHTQRGNCYVAILSETRDENLVKIAGTAPEPNGGNWRKKSEFSIDDNQAKLNRILKEATGVIYFNDNSDYIRTLYNIVGIIAGEENQNYESCKRMFNEINNKL